MNQIILCPKCNQRSWSSDYWTCSACGYSESREWLLLEENKGYLDGGKTRGDEPVLLLNNWKREQKKLCRDMVNYLLPGHNLNPVSFKSIKGSWGYTVYRENNKNKADQAKERFLVAGVLRPSFFNPNGYYMYDYLKMYTNYDQRPTQINISPKTLITEWSGDTVYGVIGGVEGTGAGFLPTTAHESAHASKEVNHDILFRPWINEAHDDVWKRVYIKFFQKLQQRYGEEVKNRFIEYRKIVNKEEDRY